MATHYMNLHHEPFISIKSGEKTIEMRLNDEKRALIKVNDNIVFKNNETNEEIKVLVINIYRYESFEELYKHHDKVSIGYKKDEIARPEDMLVYYSKEKIEKYGVLGIEIKLVK